MNLKSKKVQKYWNSNYKKIDYSKMDQNIISKFEGSHPKIIHSWLPKEKGVFITDPNYQLTKKQKKHRFMLKLERIFKLDLSKKHYKRIK